MKLKAKKIAAVILIIAMAVMYPLEAFAAKGDGARTVRILFTHDIHSFLEPTTGVNGHEHGGAGRLATLLKEYRGSAPAGGSVYLDGGDFSEGTLFQAGYLEHGFELSILSDLGCAATCPGNHEWDHGGYGFAGMLDSVLAQDHKKLPMMLCANLNLTGDLTDEQETVKNALGRYKDASGQDELEYTIYKVPGSGIRIGLFGISGEESIEDSPNSGMKWSNAVDVADKMVEKLEGKCDIIVCLSHSGTEGDGVNGEDITLAEEVPGIDFILSGHSHTQYDEPLVIGDTVIGSAGEYLENLGVADFKIAEDGTVSLKKYELVPVNEDVEPDPDVEETVSGYKDIVGEEYLKDFGYEYDQKIAHSSFAFMSLDDMYATHQEYPMGDLIADSYVYETQKNGIDDIDVMLVALGTIRGSFPKGDITVAEAFEKCSLGVGEDGSAGHPLVAAYITGKELKLLVELDASLGPMVTSVKMSYAGLEYKFNTKRLIMDRVTDVHLIDENGNPVEIEDDKLYKCCCNMYAADMLGMVNDLTKGIMSITPKDGSGEPVSDLYECALHDSSGKEIKEWVAFADYLSSFEEGESGLPEIPDRYSSEDGRKVKVSEGGIAVIRKPGLVTKVVLIAAGIILAVLIILIATAKRRRAAKEARRERKRLKKQAERDRR